jgi:hypothetical protein
MIALTDNNTTKLTCGLFGLVLQPNRLAITDHRYCLHELGTAARRKNIWKSRLKFDIMNT